MWLFFHFFNININNIQPICNFSIEEVRNAIIVFYTSSSEETRKESEKLLLSFKESDPAFQISLNLLSSDKTPCVLFLASIILQDYVRQKWDKLNSKMVENAVSIIVQILNEFNENIENPIIFRLILTLCDIILLDFDFFKYVESLPNNIILHLFFRMYETNNEDNFFEKWVDSRYVHKNLESITPLAFSLLQNVEVCNDWIELHYELYRFFHRQYQMFFPYLGKIKNAASSLCCKNKLVMLCRELLNNEMDESTDDEQFYYKELIEIMITMGDKAISYGIKTEDDYIFVLNAWNGVLNISDYFTNCGHSDLLVEVLSHLLQILPNLIQENSIFDDFLDDCSEFLVENSSIIQIYPGIIGFLDFIADLIDKGFTYFQNITISYCYNIIQQEYKELFAKYLQQKIISPSDSLFFIAGSIELDFSLHFADEISGILLSLPEKPKSSLFFIRKVGIFLENRVNDFISLVFNLFIENEDETILVIYECSQRMPQALIPYIKPILSLLGKANLSNSCLIILSFLNLISFLENDKQNIIYNLINSFIVEYSKNAAIQNPKNFDMFLQFIVKLMENSPENLSTELKNPLFANILNCMSPFLFYEDYDIQRDICRIFNLSILKWEIQNVSPIIDFVGKIIYTYPIVTHFPIIENLISYFPIPAIIEFVLNFDYNTNSEICGYIISYIIHPLLQKWDSFYQTFSPIFLVQLLTLPNIIAINNAFDLFKDICSSTIPEDFGLLILTTIIPCMITKYYEFQLRSSISLIKALIGNKVITPEAFSSIFQTFFHPSIPYVNEFILSIIQPNDENEELCILKNAIVSVKRLK